MPELTTTPRYWNEINYDYQSQVWAVFTIEIETTPETEEGEQNAGTDNNTEILE